MSKNGLRLTYAFLLVTAICINAQDIQSPFPKEAEESLLSITLNDTNVELFIRGSWQAELLHNGILQWSPFLYSMNPLLFKQVPDLYIFLAIEQSYWFEAQIGIDVESNKFAAGYMHSNDSTLLSVRLGNNGISMQSYPYLGIGNPSSSFGLKADIFDLASGSRTEVLARWDSVREETALFYGTTEISSASIHPASWLRGKAFRLPQGSTLEAVYIDTNSGTQKLFPDSYKYSSESGILLLENPSTNQVRVIYSRNNLSEEAIVYMPGSENPLELKNYYSMSAAISESSIVVRDNDSNAQAVDFSVQFADTTSFFIIRNNASNPAQDDYSKPFNANPWVYNATDSGDRSSRYAIMISTTEERDTILIPRSAIPGSLTVYRNGVETTSYTHDAETGNVELQPRPSANEEIRITYKVYSVLRNDGRVVLGAGMTNVIDDANTVKFVIAGSILVPEQVLLSSVEKLESLVAYSYVNVLGEKIIGKADFSLVAHYAVKAEYTGTSNGRWQAQNLHLTAGTPLTLSDTTAAEPALLLGSAKINVAESIPSIGFSKTDTLETSSFALFDADAMFADYSNMIVLIKKNSGDAGAMLTVSGGSGTNGITVSNIPVGTFPEGEWVLLIADYREKIISVYRQDGTAMQCPSIELVIAQNPELVRSLYFTISADVINLDIGEPLLSKPMPSFGARQDASLRWMNADRLDIIAQEQCVWQNTSEDQLVTRFLANAKWNTDAFRSTLRLGFMLAQETMLPSFGYNFTSPESLDFLAATSAFSYESDATSRLFQFSLIKYFPFTLLLSDAIRRATVTQKMALKLGTPLVFYLSTDINQYSSIPESNAAFETLYLDSWRFLWPFSAQSANNRQILATAQQAQSGLAVNAKSSFIAQSALPLQSAMNAALGPAFTFPFGTVTAQARKSFSVSRDTDATSIVDDTIRWFDATKAIILAQCTLDPFWTSGYALRISDTLAELGTGSFSDTYGLMFRRPLGLGAWDIIVPAELSIGGYSSVTNAQNMPVQKTGLESIITAKAVNMFSQYGVIPVFTHFEFDEYQWSLQGELFSYPLQQPALYYSVSGLLQMELQGKNTVRAKNTLALSFLESGLHFSLDTMFSMDIPVEKNAVSWIAEALYKALPIQTSGELNEKQLSSLWLSKLASGTPTALDRWQVSAQYGTSTALTTFLLKQKYSAESALTKALVIMFYAEFGQNLVWQADFFAFSIQYSLGFTIKATF